jgi:ubiquinone/menaquinone biosynthesis C-methylase UbiE
MDNDRNRSIYRRWAPVYDMLFAHALDRPRCRAIELLDLQPGQRLLIPGIGTGLDLPYIPAGVPVVGADISQEMLSQARPKTSGHDVALLGADAQVLSLSDASFDAALLNLILSVVPNGPTAFREVWRVLKPGGRAVIFDKFLPEDSDLTPARRLLGRVASALGTDPNRRLSEMIAGVPGLAIGRDETSLLQGQYRILLMQKAKG